MPTEKTTLLSGANTLVNLIGFPDIKCCVKYYC